MATRIPSTDVLNMQTIEAVVSGPNEANRLFTLTGMANAVITASSGITQKETFTLLVGPQLSHQQFRKAIASAFLADIRLGFDRIGSAEWALVGVDADWDDESQQVELEVELQTKASSPLGMSVTLARFGFQVTILAAV
jgi:hypothetical protein